MSTSSFHSVFAHFCQLSARLFRMVRLPRLGFLHAAETGKTEHPAVQARKRHDHPPALHVSVLRSLLREHLFTTVNKVHVLKFPMQRAGISECIFYQSDAGQACAFSCLHCSCLFRSPVPFLEATKDSQPRRSFPARSTCLVVLAAFIALMYCCHIRVCSLVPALLVTPSPQSTSRFLVGFF